MRNTAIAAALTIALTAAAPLSAASAREDRQPRLRNASPNPIVRTVDAIAKRVKTVIRSFETVTVPHPTR